MKQFFRTVALILCFTVTLSGIPVYADENTKAGESIEQPAESDEDLIAGEET